MAFQEIFSVLLDGKDFGRKVEELAKQWEVFSKTITTTSLNFNIDQKSITKLEANLNTQKNLIKTAVEDLNKNFSKPFKTTFEVDDKDLAAQLAKAASTAQKTLDANPLTVLENIQVKLGKTRAAEKAGITEIGGNLAAEKAKITRELNSIKKLVGEGFIDAFRGIKGTNETQEKLELLSNKLLKLSNSSSTAAKRSKELKEFLDTLGKGMAAIHDASLLQTRIDFAKVAKGFSPEFLDSLERFLSLQRQISLDSSSVSKSDLNAARKNFESLAELEKRRINSKKETTTALNKIASDGEADQFRTAERGGKAVLELVKRVGFKITEEGETFRPLGEAVTDFSKAAEDALARAKAFAVQAAAFKVPVSNPLHPTKIQANIALQEQLNKKIQEFLDIQSKIRKLESDNESLLLRRDLSKKKGTGISLSNEETANVAKVEGEIEDLKKASLELTAELNTLQRQSLETEKAITAEISKQLRLDADRAKIFKTISEKQSARADTVVGLKAAVVDLPTGLPKADKVRADLAKLESLQLDFLQKRVDIEKAADNLLAAQNDASRQHEVATLQKTLNEELGLLKSFGTQFDRIAGALPNKIIAASKQASVEFNKIRDAAEADAKSKTTTAAAAIDKAEQQEIATSKLRKRGANADIIALNEELLRAEKDLSTRRQQEATAANNKLSEIDKAGSLKRLQELQIVPKPAATKSTDTFEKQVKDFEAQLPDFEKLVLRKAELEAKGIQLSLEANEAKTQKEKAAFQQTISDNKKAQDQANEDIATAFNELSAKKLKTLTDETERTIKISKDSNKEATKLRKERLAEEKRLLDQHNREIESKEKQLDTEKALLADEQIKRQQFINDNIKFLNSSANTEKVLAAKAVDKQLDAVEKQRLERIRVIEKEIAQLRAHPPGVGLAPPPGAPPGTPPIPVKPPVTPPPPSMTAVITDLRKVQREQDKANAKGTFFNEILKGFEKNIGQSVGSVIKFQLAWRLAGPLISSALAPIEGVGLAIQKGLAFLIDFQERMIQVREILLQNVRFSADIATNFELGTEAAEALTRRLELASTRVNTSSEVFQQAFESFVQSGGLRAVGGDIEKAVGSVELIIQDLGSVGISLKDARRTVSEISKLLTEGVTARDALPRALKRTSDELAAIVRTAKEEGNLFEVLVSLSSNQAKSLQLSDRIFARLLDKVELFLKIFSGAFSKGLFDASLSGLQRIIEVFEKNEDTITNFASSLGSVFGSLLSTVTDLASILLKIASINPFKSLADNAERAETALESLNRQIAEKSRGTGSGAIGAVTIGPAAVANAVKAVNQALDQIVGAAEVSKLPEKALQELTTQRAGLLDELKETHVQIIEKSRLLEKETSEVRKKEIIKGSVPIFEARQLLIKKITEIDKELAKAPASGGVGMKELLRNTVQAPLVAAQRALPKEAQELGKSVGVAIETGLADAQVAVRRRLELIESDLQLFLSSIESNEARIRELTDLRFSEGVFNEVGKAKELIDSVQREQFNRIEEIRAEKKRLFGDVDDIQKFNDELERSNIRVIQLGETVEKLTQKRVKQSLVISRATDAEKAATEASLVAAKTELKELEKQIEELEKKRKRFPGLTEPKDDAEKRANALAELEGKAIKDSQIAELKARHDVNLILRKDREDKFKDDLDATKEALRQAEDLFKEFNKVRVVDESETISKVTELRQEAIKKEITDIERERKTASANSIPRQRQLITQAAKLRRESARLDQLSEIQLSIAIGKKLAFETAFQDKRVELQKEADAEILQLQVQDGVALESAIIDAQESLILRRQVNAQEDLNRQIQIAKDTQKALTGDTEGFDKSGDFKRKQQELDEDFTRAMNANSASRVIQRRKEAQELLAISIDLVKIEQQGLEQLIAVQEQGTLSNDQRLKNQVELAKGAHLVADGELRLAEVELQRLQQQQAALEPALRNIAALERQKNAVEALRQAELRAAIDQRIAERRKTASRGKRALEDVTGLDLTAVDAAREVLRERIAQVQSSIEQASKLKLGPEVIDPLREELAKLTSDFEHLRESGLSKFGNSVLSVVNKLEGAISAVIQGFQSAGIGGAVGAGLSQVGTIFQKALGAGGPIVQAAGAVVSLIASAFTAAAKRLAEKIKKAFDKTLENFRDQSETLGRTIGELERQRLQAIERLSGKKGGKKQLEELLPEFDRSIKDLIKQQQEVQDSFEDELGALRLGNDALRNFSSAWDDVNKKVQAYVDSFREGEFTLEKQQNAVEFLSRSLEKLQGDLLDDLVDAEKEAISNALELNDLFKQRSDLIKQMVKDQEEFNKAQFELLTADAIEARVAGVVQRGNALVKLREDFADKQKETQEQIRLLNLEIAAKQKVFEKTKSIFNLTLDTGKLKDRQNQLDEQSLDRQIQKWKDIQAIINGIKRDPVTGNFSLDPALQSQISPRITNVTVGAPQIKIDINTGGAPITPNQIIDPMTAFFADQSRFGFNNS